MLRLGSGLPILDPLPELVVNDPKLRQLENPAHDRGLVRINAAVTPWAAAENRRTCIYLYTTPSGILPARIRLS